MMGWPKFAIGHARTHAAENDRKSVVGSVDLDLLQRAPGQEGRRRANERYKPADGEPGGNPDHVLFSDSNVDEAFGKELLELTEVARADAVVADRDNARIRLGKFDERLSEGLTAIERLDLRGRQVVHQTSSLRASST